MTKTVYVLGAGASKEVGLPVGEELMEMIKPLLDKVGAGASFPTILYPAPSSALKH